MPKTLAQKMCVREGYKIGVVGAPKGYDLGKLPKDITSSSKLTGKLDWIQYFAIKQAKLEKDVTRLEKALKDEGLLWIAYPNAKQLDTDLNRDIRAKYAKTVDLRPVAQISSDNVWSALRFKAVV